MPHQLDVWIPFRLFQLISRSIGHPPHSLASPVELRLRVGPRALSGKKISKVTGGVEICPSVCLERSKGEEAWGEKVGNYNIG